LSPFGRFIKVGKKDVQDNCRIELNPFLRQVVMASVDLTNYYEPQAEEVGIIDCGKYTTVCRREDQTSNAEQGS